MAPVVRWLCVALVAGLAVGRTANAQGGTGTLTGRVTDSTSKQPIGSVTVAVVGSRVGGITRDDGTYTIVNVPEGAQRVRVTRIGYSAREQDVQIVAGGTTTLNFALNTVATQLNQVVVVGYGQQRREAVTGSVAQVDAEQARVGVVANADQMVQGRVAGVNIVSANGEPGGNVQIRIRGGTSLSASNEPLYVIDGVPIQNEGAAPGGVSVGGINAALGRNPLNSLNPNDIESITILKDASSTAIYGSRGANGVVLIQTKRGTGRTSTIEYETYASSSTPSNDLDFLTGDQYRSFVNDQVAIWRADSTNNVPLAQRRGLPSSRLGSLGTANTDWEDEVTRRGYAVSHNLAFAGGSAQTQYRASLNYFDQQGVVISNGMKRYQARLNGQTQGIGGRLNLEMNLTASRVNNDYLPFENTGGFTGGIFTNVAIFDPTRSVFDTSGRYYETGGGAQDVRNPVALANQVIDESPENRVLGNVTGRLTLVPGLLTSQTTIGTDYTSAVRRTYFPLVSPVGAASAGYARQAERSTQNVNFQQLLTVTPDLGQDNTVDVVGGYEYSEFDNSGFDANARGFITDAFTFYNLSGGTQAQSSQGSYRVNSKLVSFFGRANYSFKNRYNLTGVLRYDGSSRLAEGNQWSTFPAVAASWRISEEPFMQNMRPFGLSTLAVRLGWGRQGNQAVRPYGTQLLLRADEGARYVFGTGLVSGLVAGQVANPDLKWETAEQENLGFDFGFRENKITGVLDFYNKKTKDLLLDVSVPQPAVVSTRLENVGSISNKGMELSLDADLYETNTRMFAAGLVMTVERNEVTDLGGRTFIATGGVSGQGQSGRNSQRIIVGEPLGTFWGATYVGVDSIGRQLFACNRTAADCVNGRTLTYTADDEGVIGNALPDFTLGFRSNGRWGKFDASWLWRGEFGREVFNNTALVYSTKTNVNQSRNFMASALNDPIALGEPAVFSSRWIEDGSFVRLQNVTVGYSLDLPQRFGSGRTARFYLSGDNLLLFSDYSGYDPEVFVASGLASRGIDYLTYPRARTFTLGTRLQF
jgi:TonB-dependent starch-binding outer membrane protein SusC